MSEIKKIAFILGGGPRIGLSAALAFRDQGYLAILGRRKPDYDGLKEQGLIGVPVDVTSPESIADAFRKVREHGNTGSLGIPNVVVYNAAALTVAGGKDDGLGIFGIDAETYKNDLAVNLVGGYAALHETVKGWKELDAGGGKEMKKVFIATGNVVPWKPVPMAMTLGSGKAALAHLIETAMMSDEYQEKGWKFYFVSQVTQDEGPVPYEQVDGDRHGKEYVRIVEQGDENWDFRFAA